MKKLITLALEQVRATPYFENKRMVADAFAEVFAKQFKSFNTKKFLAQANAIS